MKDESVFVSIDEDLSDVVVIDMDDSFYSDFVTLDESYEDTDFITLSDDVEIASDADIIDIFAGMDDADISIIV
ncbi:MAG: hypothetical protein LBT83_06800 [Tannerella sp.]|jgi:hypothetical protein|nr:hypothetical protein [Tannerella sp.]